MGQGPILTAYAESSFIVSLYAPDSNSDRATADLAKVELPLLTSTVALLEVTNAFELRVFRRQGTRLNADTALADFESDLHRGVFRIVPVSPQAWETARRLSRAWSATLGTRSMDILQVATALTLQADTFLTFDRQQAALARAEGLHTPIAL